jgi:hypothetical protein
MTAGALVADERRARGSVPELVHQVLVDEFERTGSPPPPRVISELTGISSVYLTQILKLLCDRGDIIQPHGDRAPYIPLRRPDGTRVKPVLIVVSEGSQVVEAPPVGRSPEEVERALNLLDAARHLMEAAAGHTPEEVKRALELVDVAQQWMEITAGHTPEEVKRALELIDAARRVVRE